MGNEQGRWARLFSMAVDGLVTPAMAEQVGIHPTTFRRRAQREAWLKLQRTVWALPGSPVTHRLRCLAALYVVGERGLVGRRSAAYEQGSSATSPTFSNSSSRTTAAVPGARA